MRQVVELQGLEAYDEVRSIDLVVARKLLRGRKEEASLESLRRWINRRRGWKIPGQDAVLLLPAVLIGGTYRMMESWVRAFAQRRAEVSRQVTRPAPAGLPEGRRKKAHVRAEERLRRAGIGRREDG